MNVAIIGGGAAGFFSALSVKEHHPDAEVVIFEKSKKVLSKVKISGGGRCNVTNGTHSISTLSKAYPRGGAFLKKLFPIWSTRETMEWFESRGVALVVQEDLHVFPRSQDSQSIIDCFLRECRKNKVEIKTSHGIKALHKVGDQFELTFIDSAIQSQTFDKVIVTTGGSPKRRGLEWLETLGHQIEDPVPSLFTFNMPKDPICELMGIVNEKTMVTIQGSKLKSEGPLLITHWGMSGPAIIVLSAFGARLLNDMNYEFTVQVNWVNEGNQESVRSAIQEIIAEHPRKLLTNVRPYYLKDRLWQHLLRKADFPGKKTWDELGKKGLNKVVTLLTNDTYAVKGKSTFKEEFVTCGGVSLKSIHPKTMESKEVEGLYFAGEVLDIDGITGGYNFQAAWTTAYIAGKLAE